MQTFVVEIPVNDPEKMQEFQKVMNDYHKEVIVKQWRKLWNKNLPKKSNSNCTLHSATTAL